MVQVGFQLTHVGGCLVGALGSMQQMKSQVPVGGCYVIYSPVSAKEKYLGSLAFQTKISASGSWLHLSRKSCEMPKEPYQKRRTSKLPRLQNAIM